MKEIPHRRSDFTRRRRISLAKQISQIPKGIYFVEKKPPFSIFREVWLRQVKQRRCRCEVLCCAQCEVKCSASYRAEVTLHARSALHLRSILRVPRKRNTSFEKSHICLVDKCGIFRGAADRTRTGTVSLPADFKSALSTYSNTAADTCQRVSRCTAFILAFLFLRVKPYKRKKVVCANIPPGHGEKTGDRTEKKGILTVIVEKLRILCAISQISACDLGREGI